MPCGSATRPGDPRIVARELAPDVVLVDVARLPGRSGPQLLSVSAEGLGVESLAASPGDASSDPRLAWPIPGGLPLPPRPRGISRVQLADDWHSTGRPTALVPSLDGAWLVDLANGRPTRLPMPVYADYLTWEPYLPVTVWKWMIQEVTWPALARADDNGDGRLDLFALSRWAIWIYHAGPGGLPSEPSRRIELVPFDEETERRHEATNQSYFARDLDGDGRADLLLTSVSGGLMQGESTTRIHLGHAGGVDPNAAPDAVRRLDGGFSAIHFVDLDSDGREEMIETSIEFGLVQLVRILLTRRAETKIRVLSFDPTSEDGTRVLFEDEIAFRLDFGESSVSGLVPGVGDWNGDRVQDLYLARGDDEIVFRLGSQQTDAPLFGRATGRQEIPLRSGQSRSADLDGDGLDEIIAFNPAEPEDPLVVLHNLGRLPGTRPELRASP
jgi:hypothetical protein